MTKNEAKNLIKNTMPSGNNAFSLQLCEALAMAIDALEEVQRYQEIGTVEDFKRAKNGELSLL